MTKLMLTGVNYSYSFIANKIILGVFITGRPDVERCLDVERKLENLKPESMENR